MSKWIEGTLGYNLLTGRYGLLVTDLFEKDFHCGDVLQIKVDDEWIDTRMEMTADEKWYLVGTSYKDDLDYIRARIRK